MSLLWPDSWDHWTFLPAVLWGGLPLSRKAARLLRSGSPFTIESLMTLARITSYNVCYTKLLRLLLVAALVGLLVSWLLGRTTRPLKQLARQAEHFSRGEDIPPLPETGPLEIRETLIAFNRIV